MKGKVQVGVLDAATAAVLTQAEPGLEALCQRVEQRFRRPEVRQRLRRYITALFAPLPRKNGWQLAEETGERSPDGVQELLNAARWDADAVRDDLRQYVVEHLGDPQGVLVVDETGFLKKGTHSVGVMRQYSGTAGRVENCQLGVFLPSATEQGRTFLDRELYLPQEWAGDPERCERAGVPPAVKFATKPQLAQRMLKRALDAGVPCAWVTGDAVYGRDVRLRRFLEGQRQPYVLGVGKDEEICPECAWLPRRKTRVEQAAARLPAAAWERQSCGAGTKGPRLYDWAWLPLFSMEAAGWGHWLLVRRSTSDPRELAYYRVFGRTTVTRAEVVGAAGGRWKVEESFETGKELVGLDQYEVRKWDAWYRYITLAALAHAFLCVLRAQVTASEPVKGGPGSPDPPAIRAIGRAAHSAHRSRGAPLALPPGLELTARSGARLTLVRLATQASGASAALPLPPPPRPR